MNESKFETEVSVVVDMVHMKVGRDIGGARQEADMPINVVFPDEREFSYRAFRTLLTQTALDAGLVEDGNDISKIFWRMSQTPEYDYDAHNTALFTFTAVPSLPFNLEGDLHIRWDAQRAENSKSGVLYTEKLVDRSKSGYTSLGIVQSDDHFDSTGSEWDYPIRRARRENVEATLPWYFHTPPGENIIVSAYVAANEVAPTPWTPTWD